MNEIITVIVTVIKEKKIDLKQAIIDLVKEYKPSLTGRLITIHDNSYILNLSKGEKRDGYHHSDLRGCELVVLSPEPYSVQVNYGFMLRDFGPHYVQMVRAISLETGDEYEVMFHEAWLRKES